MKFNRHLTQSQLIFIAIGGMVGSGWLFGPLYAAHYAGPAAMVSWALGGFLMLFIALTFAELAALFPKAGSLVHFANETHGPLLGFLIAWVAWLASVVVAPIETMALLQYAGNYLPWLLTEQTSGVILSLPGILCAIVLMGMLVFGNQYGVKHFGKTNSVIVVWKLLIPIITIGILLCHPMHSSNFTAFGGFMPTGLHGIFSALPRSGIIFSFIGYSAAIQMAGEANNPQKTIPIAIIGSILGCIVLYCVLQTVFIASLPSSSLDAGWTHLHFAGDAGPFAGLLGIFGITYFVKVLYIDAIISPIGTSYIYTSATARLLYAMAKQGFFPKEIHSLNKHGVPQLALWINFVVGLLFFMPFPSWQQMMTFLVSCFILGYVAGPVACLVMRRQHPTLKRPFYLPFAPVLCACAFIVCSLLLYWSGWPVLSKLLLLVLIGTLFYLAFHHFIMPEKPQYHVGKTLWFFAYLLGLGALSYAGNFGGQHLLTMGWEMIALPALSLVFFFWALKTHL